MRYYTVVPIAAVAACLAGACYSTPRGASGDPRDAYTVTLGDSTSRIVREQARQALLRTFSAELAKGDPMYVWFTATEDGKVLRSGTGFPPAHLAKTVTHFTFTRGAVNDGGVTVVWGVN